MSLIFKHGDKVRIKNGVYRGTVGKVKEHSGMDNKMTITFEEPLDHDWSPDTGLMTPIYSKNYPTEDLELIEEQPFMAQIVHTTLEEAMRAEMDSKKAKYNGEALEWYNAGRCPKCGALGYYHLSTPICKIHGQY